LFFHEREIAKLNWGAIDIDFVIESTGKYKTFEDINQHIVVGAKKVIYSAPSEVPENKNSGYWSQRTPIGGYGDNSIQCELHDK